MKLEEQLCSLDLAKRLKKLGVKQESTFWYEQDKEAGRNVWSKDWRLAFNNYSKPYDDKHICSAFSVAELGDMLPIKIATGHRGISSDLLGITKGTWENGDRWQVMYYDEKFFNAPTEADARARMLIYLLKNNLISPA